jgi:hypothetical protein
VRIEDYVHDYNSVERFKATYQFDIYPMVDKEQWHEVDLGFVMVPPKLERHVGRPRVCRIKGSGVRLEKEALINASDASSLAILKRPVVSPLMNWVMNYHHRLRQGTFSTYFACCFVSFSPFGYMIISLLVICACCARIYITG